MKSWRSVLLSLVLLSTQLTLPVLSQTASKNGGGDTTEAQANTSAYPTQILKTGVNLFTTGTMPNTRQLSDNIGLTPILERIQTLRGSVSTGGAPTLESLAARQELWDAKQEAALIILRVNLDIDFAIGEIDAETQVYNEILSTFTGERDKLLARVNAGSFISNGVLWAACEGLSIPSFNTVYAKNPRNVVQWPIPAGIVGIAAGLVPSFASMYTLKAVNGKMRTSEVEPNMLAKLFGYPTNPEIEYPKSVWDWLQQVPASDPKSKKRMDQIIDRWISDSNMPSFTDRKSKKQLDVLTASVAQRKGLSIATLSSRTIMLQQLRTEIMKMKRMLVSLTMVVQGDKQI
jgi:hypothetical protein